MTWRGVVKEVKALAWTLSAYVGAAVVTFVLVLMSLSGAIVGISAAAYEKLQSKKGQAK